MTKEMDWDGELLGMLSLKLQECVLLGLSLIQFKVLIL